MNRKARWIKPRALPQGGTVGVVAPAGPVDADLLQIGLDTLRDLGFSVIEGTWLRASAGYLAGADRDRADDLRRFLRDPQIDAVVAARGGYGCTRLIPYLAPNLPRLCRKPLVGFSDVTALHLWYLRARVVTFHGPVVAGKYAWCSDTISTLLRTLMAPKPLGSFPHPAAASEKFTLNGGRARGRLVGGNLSLLLASLGTPYEIDTEGAILFIEEVNEPAYRIDRMITQLLHAGKLEGVSGLVFGEFIGCHDFAGRGYREIATEIAEFLGIPCISGLTCGHGPHRLTLPLGVMAELDADSRDLYLIEGAVRC